MNECPQQLWLEISPIHEAEAIAQSQAYSNDVARRNAYLSHLCLQTVMAWLKSEFDEPITIVPNAASSIWEFLSGASLQIGETKLALIPSETVNPDQFCVPFEWLEIPTWAANYYLAVQMNVEEDEHWLRVWGFATHQRLKAGKADIMRRLYTLDRQDLIENLNVLWTARSLNLESDVIAMTLPTCSLDRLESLLEKLSQPTPYCPRLEVDFDQWAAILSNEFWRQLLCQRRQQAEAAQPIQTMAPVNLRQWLNQKVEETWQAVEAVLAPAQAISVRGSSQPEALEAIAPILRLVQSNSSEQIRQQAAGVLGEIGGNHPEAINVLVELLQTAQQEETRWQAALSLGKIAPHHPLAGIRRARLIDLGLQLDQHQIALIVAIMPKTSDRLGVFLQVQSVMPQSPLPPYLKVSVLSDLGETRLKAETRSDEATRGKDNSIDLRFSPPAGTRFQVKIELNDAYVLEEFLT
ncbi:MAG: DUF1822 family protein [Leptolyngbyaceae cyanobacterium CSU_1_3]|nr:DUF1822 family protein [Leptolyngbyaceae cyanobacterium CSU_1_3]